MGLIFFRRSGCNRSTDRFADFDDFRAEYRAAFPKQTLRHIDHLLIESLNPILKFSRFLVNLSEWQWAGHGHKDAT